MIGYKFFKGDLQIGGRVKPPVKFLRVVDVLSIGFSQMKEQRILPETCLIIMKLLSVLLFLTYLRICHDKIGDDFWEKLPHPSLLGCKA